MIPLGICIPSTEITCYMMKAVRHVPPLANSPGFRCDYIDSDGQGAFSSASQLSLFALVEVQENSPEWACATSACQTEILRKLMFLDCYPIWFARKSSPRAQIIDAVCWQTPIGIRTHLSTRQSRNVETGWR